MKNSVFLLLLFALVTGNYAFAEVNIQTKDGTVELYNKSYALVIGAVDYNNGWAPLEGVAQDVERVSEALKKQGFEVVTVKNPASDELVKAYSDFINTYGLEAENRLLFYFAGHGHTVNTTYGEKMGYIVPVDAANPFADERAFVQKAMPMQQIEVFAKQIQAKHALFLFDACFSGSIFSLSRAAPENISYKTSQPVRQFISSGSEDEKVPDESVFCDQFITALNGDGDVNRDGYITGSELGEFLQSKVVNYSYGAQTPQYGKIRNPRLDKGDFVFKAGGGELVKETDNSQQQPVNVAMDMRSASPSVQQPAAKLPTSKESWEDQFKSMKRIFAQVTLKTKEGQYVRADGGGGKEVYADREKVGFHETYEVVPLDGKNIALKTHNGHYLTVNDDNVLDATEKKISSKSTFKLITLEGTKVGFKAYNGKFLCAVDGGGDELKADREQLRGWETFEFIPLRTAAVKSFNGYFVCADKNDSKVFKEIDGQEMLFDFVRIDSTHLALKTPSGKYLMQNADGSCQFTEQLNGACCFEYIEYPDNYAAFKAPDGRYLTAVGGGGFALKADAKSIDDFEKFKIEIQKPKNE